MLGSEVLPVYCHMTDALGACGDGGWTLVMKIDGNQVGIYSPDYFLRYFWFYHTITLKTQTQPQSSLSIIIGVAHH